MDYLLHGFLQGFVLLFTGDPETFSAVWATVGASTLSMTASLSIGVPLGFLLGYNDFPGKKILRTIVDTLLSFPTVVIGLLVYAFLTRNGPLGSTGLLFTLPGMAMGQTLLGLPIIIAMTATAVEGLDKRLPMTLITLGANPRQMMWATVLEARYSIMLAAMAAYGRIVSEVGISMMVGGNIKWHTRTITTAIALETGKGEFAVGIALGMVLLAVALLVNIGASGLKRKAVPMNTPLASLKNIRQRHADRTVLSIDTLDIEAGSIIGLAGPNGSGKSTLLRILACLDAPAEGEFLFLGHPASPKFNTTHRLITLLVQEPYLLKRTVYANVAYGLKLRKKNDIPAKVDRALEVVGLDPDKFRKRQWFELSGGEVQRVALAARLVLKPKLLLMDEPTASLDEKSALLIRQAAMSAREEYCASLVVASHDMTWLKAIADRIIHLENGIITNISQHSPGEPSCRQYPS